MANRMTFNFLQTVIDQSKAGYTLRSVDYDNGYLLVTMTNPGSTTRSLDLFIAEDPTRNAPRVYRAED